MFTTYYTQSSGQPQNNTQSHEALADAIAAWDANCAGMSQGSGGRSVVVDEDDGEDLVWLEHVNGAYATGAMAERLLSNLDAEAIDSSAKVAAIIVRVAV